MRDSIRAAAKGIFFAASVAGTAYTAAAVLRTRAFRRQEPKTAHALPPITVFKPLHGDEPHLYENLKSFCDQEYPDFQIVFSAASAADPALAVARRLQAEFPDRDISVTSGAADAENPKIANVLHAYALARHGIIALADSDIRVGNGYLRALAAGFEEEDAGAVTCLYGAAPDATLASRLGAMHVNDGFAPSVLVAQLIEPLTYCFGATMAVRRSVLEGAGGLRVFGDRLGDDYHLGQAVVRQGYAVKLSPYVVQTDVADPTLASLWRRELRWARTIRTARPAGYTGSVITFALPLAAIAALVAPSRATAALLATASALRVMLHSESRKTFAPAIAQAPWLIPLRDALSVAVWVCAFFGSGVRWRSDGYRVEAGGRMAGGPNGM